jgi:serine/threonine protein kinase
MVTTDLGACEWFVWDLRRSNLLDRGRLDQVVGEFLEKNPRGEPAALAEYLVGQGVLTQFQADRLLQGKTQGFVLGPYTLMDALGSGSMGTVYKARSKNDDAWYAVKVLPRRSMWNVRVARRKVRVFEQCKHPAVVPFIDVGTSGGMHYLAWPLVEGEPLDRLVERDGKLPPDVAAHALLQAAEGLHACHQQGLFHGLLKPSNLMIGTDGQLRILDFGIGSLLAETDGESLVDTMSTANSVASGLDCASPESIMDPTALSPLGDQYSLGCVLYYCLTGRYPFPDGATAEKMLAHQFKQPTPVKTLVPEIPDELAGVVERLMQKTPEARYASTGDLVEALQSYLKTASAAALPVPRPIRPRSAERKAAAESAEPVRREARPLPEVKPRFAAAASALPSRQSLHGTASPASPLPERPPSSLGRATPEKKPSSHSQSVTKSAEPEPSQAARSQSLEERIGPIGIAIAALGACALAWLLTWRLF